MRLGMNRMALNERDRFAWVLEASIDLLGESHGLTSEEAKKVTDIQGVRWQTFERALKTQPDYLQDFPWHPGSETDKPPRWRLGDQLARKHVTSFRGPPWAFEESNRAATAITDVLNAWGETHADPDAAPSFDDVATRIGAAAVREAIAAATIRLRAWEIVNWSGGGADPVKPRWPAPGARLRCEHLSAAADNDADIVEVRHIYRRVAEVISNRPAGWPKGRQPPRDDRTNRSLVLVALGALIAAIAFWLVSTVVATGGTDRVSDRSIFSVSFFTGTVAALALAVLVIFTIRTMRQPVDGPATRMQKRGARWKWWAGFSVAVASLAVQVQQASTGRSEEAAGPVTAPSTPDAGFASSGDVVISTPQDIIEFHIADTPGVSDDDAIVPPDYFDTSETTEVSLADAEIVTVAEDGDRRRETDRPVPDSPALEGGSSFEANCSWATFDGTRYDCEQADVAVDVEVLGDPPGSPVTVWVGFCVRVVGAPWPSAPATVELRVIESGSTRQVRGSISPLPSPLPVRPNRTNFNLRAVLSVQGPPGACDGPDLRRCSRADLCERRMIP